MIRVQCPACKQAFDFGDYLAGLTVVCKNCTQRITVPASTKSMEAGKESVQSGPPAVEGTKVVESLPLNTDIAERTTLLSTPNLPIQATIPEVPSIRKTSNAPAPEWALERVKAMLTLGKPIPEIVNNLTAKGLSAETASTAIDQVLEERVQPAMTEVDRAERVQAAHRWTSLSIAVGTVIFAGFYFTERYAVWTAFRSAIPVACIWFPEWIGSVWIFGTSPGEGIQILFIRVAAWIFLLALVIRTIWMGLAIAS